MAEDEPKPIANGLTDQQANFVVEWVTSKSGGAIRPCTVCGAVKWQLGAHIVSPPRIENGGLQIGGTIYPFIPMMCTNCGNTLFLNTAIMGLPKKEGET